MSTIPCPRCASQTNDGLLCRECTHKLRKDLAELPWLFVEIETTITRQSVSGEQVKVKGGRDGVEDDQTEGVPSGLPFDWSAADDLWAASNTLTTWARDLDMGDMYLTIKGCWCTPYAACRGFKRLQVDRPTRLAEWLLLVIERMRMHPDVDEMVDEITYAISTLRRGVFGGSQDGLVCGPCDICGKVMYAGINDKIVECRHCLYAGIESARYPVDGRRQDLYARAEREPLTKRQILDAAPLYGLPINPSTFRSWTSDGRLEPVGDSKGVPLYRLGAALDLARTAKSDTRDDACA